ncbi:Branched-chain amino acid aminotransferase 2, chloroplastic [Vitis vinifera]|uniref:Branched-chain amino acid aminotransferase 2, chloroplastic n=1 Tax=Vitis vinifera TaxID=29760 RepID=A0A438KRY4_VITVI|nr:Branched-chain amino acid aminotransferase 2, chloroplastic [Vitis vinifera]
MESAAVFSGLGSNYLLGTSRGVSSHLPHSSMTKESPFLPHSRYLHFLVYMTYVYLQKQSSFASFNNVQAASSARFDAAVSGVYSEVSELADMDWDNLGFGFMPTDYMYVMKCSRGGNFSKGELQRFGNIEMNPSAGVLNYGQGLFEGLKAYKKEDGKILLFRPEENAQRMRMGAERMCMPSPTVEQFVEAVKVTVLANERWVSVLGLAPSPEYTFLIYVSPVGNYFKEGLAPINLVIEAEVHRAAPGGTGGVKTIGNYAAVSSEGTVCCKAKGYSDVLYLDCVHKKYLEEVSSCNVFTVKFPSMASIHHLSKNQLPMLPPLPPFGLGTTTPVPASASASPPPLTQMLSIVGNVISTPSTKGRSYLALHGRVLLMLLVAKVFRYLFWKARQLLVNNCYVVLVFACLSYEMQVEERPVSVDELLDADEVFCTGTAVVYHLWVA